MKDSHSPDSSRSHGDDKITDHSSDVARVGTVEHFWHRSTRVLQQLMARGVACSWRPVQSPPGLDTDTSVRMSAYCDDATRENKTLPVRQLHCLALRHQQTARPIDAYRWFDCCVIFRLHRVVYFYVFITRGRPLYTRFAVQPRLGLRPRSSTSDCCHYSFQCFKKCNRPITPHTIIFMSYYYLMNYYYRYLNYEFQIIGICFVIER